MRKVEWDQREEVGCDEGWANKATYVDYLWGHKTHSTSKNPECYYQSQRCVK